jgi:hypothetical protein
MPLPLSERLTGAAFNLASAVDSTPRDAEVCLSRIHAGCLVLMLHEAATSIADRDKEIADLRAEAQRTRGGW